MSEIHVVEPASTRLLTTLARARSLGLTEADDTKLALNLGVASAALERATDRVFARERVIETITTEAPGAIFLERIPVVTVHAIAWGVRPAAMIDLEAGSWSVLNRWTGAVALGGRFWGGFDPYGFAGAAEAFYGWADYGVSLSARRALQVTLAVEYTGGYALPGQTGAPETDPRLMLPPDLEQATVELVRWSVVDTTVTPGLVSKRLGDASWTYAQPSEALTAARNVMPSVVRDAIQAYRRVPI
jgi:hypothetical protein